VERQGPDEGATTHKGQGPAGAWDRDRQGSHAQVFAPASRHLPDKAEGAVSYVLMRASGVRGPGSKLPTFALSFWPSNGPIRALRRLIN